MNTTKMNKAIQILDNDKANAYTESIKVLDSIKLSMPISLREKYDMFNKQDITIGEMLESLLGLMSERLEQLRAELRAERISYGELLELQSLAEYIDKDDVELRGAIGINEY